MWKRQRTILETAKSIEAERLIHEQRDSRAIAELAINETMVDAQVQSAVNIIAGREFTRAFGCKPKVVADAPINNAQEADAKYTSPVFAIEYANVQYEPGPFCISTLRSKIETKRRRVVNNSHVKNLVRKYYLKDKDEEELVIEYYDTFIAQLGTGFQAVEICSGCQSWGQLAWSNRRLGFISVQTPTIEDYDSIVRDKEIFEDGASGLAIDCGTVSVFQFFDTPTGSKNKTVVMCPSLLSQVREFNARNRTS